MSFTRKVASLVGGLLLAGPAAPAVVHLGLLSFDAAPCHACFSLRPVAQEYGDVAGVVDLSYFDMKRAGQSLKLWDSGYNDLQNVAYASGGDAPGQSHGRIEIRPLGGNAVRLDAMDFGAWLDATLATRIRVYEIGGADALFAYDGNVGDGAVGHASFAPGVSSVTGLWIDWFDTATNVGIDNVRFTIGGAAPVSEPAPLALLVFGLGALALALTRRR